jgi:uncharacterized protein (DUF302 family)
MEELTMQRLIMSCAALLAAPALADIEQVPAEGSVETVMNRLESTVVTAGATVFAKVDHGAGAESIGSPISASQLLIFGNPKLGTPAISDDPLAGLVLPLKVLVYEDGDGQTWIAYEEVDEMFDDLAIDDDAEYVETIGSVLDGFIEAAAEE